jgi:hypothetical protein
MNNEDELRDHLEVAAANLRRTRRYLREAEQKYPGLVAIVGMGTSPALTTWRRGDRGESVAADWRYRVTWTPAAESGSAALSGTWLLVAPAWEKFSDMVTQCAVAMAGRGARVDTMLVDCRTISWEVLAGLLEDALAGDSLRGVVSFLGLNETSPPERPAVPAGLAATLALTEALCDAGITVPLWVLTRDAAPPGLERGDLEHGDLDHGDLEHGDRVSGPIDRSAESGARAAILLCTVLTRWDVDQAAAQPASAAGGQGAPDGQRRLTGSVSRP